MEVVMDYRNIFETNEEFTREGLLEWARALGEKHGMVLVIKNSESGSLHRKPRLTLACERSGSYRTSSKDYIRKQKERNTGSKKCLCPFELKGIWLPIDLWSVEVVHGVHNHPMLKAFEGHSFMGRLTDNETKILVELSTSLVKPKHVLNTIKKRNPSNYTIMKTIYNVRQKLRLVNMGGRSQMQQLMKKLGDNKYVEWHTMNKDTEAVTSIFYAHPLSVELVRSFPQVLIMDCTYKTNRYKLPLLQIVGVSSTMMTFVVAFAYLESEKEECYIWALTKLKILLEGCSLPKVVLTDRELALMNALGVVFPGTHNLLCRFHIFRNVQGAVRKHFETNDSWQSFNAQYKMVIFASTESEYVRNLKELEKKFCGYQQAIAYIKESWLDKYKDRFVAAWVDKTKHYGNTTTNRVESAHSKLKKYLGTSNIAFDVVWDHIDGMLRLQHSEVKASFEKILSTVQHMFKPFVFKELRNFVSVEALMMVSSEASKSDSIGPNIDKCGGCTIRHTHGLPCAHEIVEYKRENRPIPLSSVDNFWKKLELGESTEDAEPIISCKFELEQLQKRFDESDIPTKIHLLRKIKELANPATTYLQEPDIKMDTKGRSANPKTSKKKRKQDTSTTRVPSMWEYEMMGVKVSPPKKKTKITEPEVKMKKKDERVKPEKLKVTRSMYYIKQFPSSIRSYIVDVQDVKSDGNCGFRCVALHLGRGEDEFPSVRKELIEELIKHKWDYMLLFPNDGYEQLVDRLDHPGYGTAPYEKWMDMPDMAHIVACCYGIVVIYISPNQCLTFHPLRTIAPPLPKRSVLCMGYVNGNHFVRLIMADMSPIPPTAVNCRLHREACALGWEPPYRERMAHFKTLVGANVATKEVHEISDDE